MESGCHTQLFPLRSRWKFQRRKSTLVNAQPDRAVAGDADVFSPDRTLAIPSRIWNSVPRSAVPYCAVRYSESPCFGRKSPSDQLDRSRSGELDLPQTGMRESTQNLKISVDFHPLSMLPLPPLTVRVRAEQSWVSELRLLFPLQANTGESLKTLFSIGILEP